MKNISVGDVYWMPAATHLNKRAKDEKVIVTKVGSKFVYANKETGTEYKFTFESEGQLRLVNNMCSSTAYSQELWEKQKLIIELNQVMEEFRISFPQVSDRTDFTEYGNMVSRMKEITDVILKKLGDSNGRKD